MSGHYQISNTFWRNDTIKLDIRFVNDVTYGDLRQNPTILIGAHNNIWTLNMTENLRFGFQGHSTIVDRFAPQKQWTRQF